MLFPRYLVILLLLCAVATLIAGCSTKTTDNSSFQAGPAETAAAGEANNATSWVTIPVTDAVTGKTTTIDEMASQGKPVIMHTFAVWCPACSMQLKETKKLLQSNPDRFIILGVDIDPRENTVQVRNHVEKNQFVGMYTSVPPEFTRSLMRTVGDQIVRSLPQTVIICNTSITYIGDGVFPEKKLDIILSDLCEKKN